MGKSKYPWPVGDWKMSLLSFRLILLSLFLVSCGAQRCSSTRKFSVNNCTACPIYDPTRPGNIPMAVCEATGNMTFRCVCGNFPAKGLVLALRYYPHREGDGVLRCVDAHATAPYLFSAAQLLIAFVLIYVATHLFYITLLSRICYISRLF